MATSELIVAKSSQSRFFRLAQHLDANGPGLRNRHSWRNKAIFTQDYLHWAGDRLVVYTHQSMGRQTRFHMLPEDCCRFVVFLQDRDPVIVTDWHSSELAEIQEVSRPWERGGHYCLWNQAILPALTMKQTGKYFNIDFSAPVIEFTYESPVLEPWNGQPALTQGSWASFETDNKAFEKWYNAVIRWIRKTFVRDRAVGHDRDSIGPAAYEWFRAGGLLLPNFRPPLTDAWLAWADVQNQHRTDLRGQGKLS